VAGLQPACCPLTPQLVGSDSVTSGIGLPAKVRFFARRKSDIRHEEALGDSNLSYCVSNEDQWGSGRVQIPPSRLEKSLSRNRLWLVGRQT
jgi:hypothetical protein